MKVCAEFRRFLGETQAICARVIRAVPENPGFAEFSVKRPAALLAAVRENRH